MSVNIITCVYIMSCVIILLEHSNFFGIDDIYGPIDISLRWERMDEDTSPVTVAVGSTGAMQSKYLYRIIVCTCQVGMCVLCMCIHMYMYVTPANT